MASRALEVSSNQCLMLNEWQRFVLCNVALLISLVFLGSYFFFDLNDELFLWISVITSSASLGMILARTGHDKMKMAALLLFISAYHVAPLLRGGGGGIPSRIIIARDSGYQMQLDSLVVESGSWRPGMGVGYAYEYSFYPMMPILAAIATCLIEPRTDLLFFANVTFPIATAILPLIFYVKFTRMCTGNMSWALWSGYVFSLNTQFLFFDNSFSYESLAIVFFTAAFYLLAKRLKGPGMFLSTLFLAALAFSHFWSSLNMVIFLAIFYLAPLVLRIYSRTRYSSVQSDSNVFQPALAQVLLQSCLFFGYTMFVAALLLPHWGQVALVLLHMVGPTERLLPNLRARSYPLEILIMISGQAVLGLYAVTAFFARGRGPSTFLKLTFLLGGAYLATILFGLPAGISAPIEQRGFFFGFLAIAPVVAWTIANSAKEWRRQAKGLLLVFTVLSVVIIQEPSFRYADFVAPKSQIYSGTWARENIPFASAFVSTRSVSEVFGTYGRMNDLGLGPLSGEDALVLASYLQGNVSKLAESYDSHYVAFSSYGSERLLHTYVEKYTALPGREYLSRTLQCLAQEPGLSKILNSGYVSLYYVAF